MLLHRIKTVLIHFAFRAFSDSAGLKLAKRFNMEKQAIKALMYGGINELMHNSKYYYRSSVGKSYSHWTDEGKIALQQFMIDMTMYMWDAEESELDKRAKDMVIKELKS